MSPETLLRTAIECTSRGDKYKFVKGESWEQMICTNFFRDQKRLRREYRAQKVREKECINAKHE